MIFITTDCNREKKTIGSFILIKEERISYDRYFKKVFDVNQRQIKRMQKTVEQIDALESSIKPLTDEQLKGKTLEFKERLTKGETVDDLLPEAFAVVREAATRVLGMRPYGVQLMGGIALHEGNISEMKTGEGKTLTSTLPVYLNALTGKGVHVVTVNEYLAQRDASEMGQLHEFLGLTVGINLNSMSREEKQEAYALILRIAQIMSLDSITYVITWFYIKSSAFNVHFTLLLSMKSILF